MCRLEHQIPTPTPPVPPDEQEPRPRRAAAERPASVWLDNSYRVTGRTDGAAHLAVIPEPATLEEALASDQAEFWQQAMDEEYASLLANQTWNLERPPTGIKPIPVKWVYKVKRDSAFFSQGVTTSEAGRQRWQHRALQGPSSGQGLQAARRH